MSAAENKAPSGPMILRAGRISLKAQQDPDNCGDPHGCIISYEFPPIPEHHDPLDWQWRSHWISKVRIFQYDGENNRCFLETPDHMMCVHFNNRSKYCETVHFSSHPYRSEVSYTGPVSHTGPLRFGRRPGDSETHEYLAVHPYLPEERIPEDRAKTKYYMTPDGDAYIPLSLADLEAFCANCSIKPTNLKWDEWRRVHKEWIQRQCT
jgi:hypothetical protein